MPVYVAVRPRPLLSPEIEKQQVFGLELATGSEAAVRIAKDGEPKCYFNKVFSPEATQDDVYEAVGRPAVADVMRGTSAAIFVYGQTGSGKTYTLGFGDEKGYMEPGIQQKAVGEMFRRGQDMQDHAEMTVEVEYLQVYKEDMLDLLNPRSERLEIRMTAEGTTLVEGATKKVVADEEEFHEVADRGERTRRAELYEMGANTARSHAILIITVRVTPHDLSKKPTEANLYLVDLAGSERLSGRSSGVHALRESAAINQSLTVLGIVVHGIANNESHIPYRDSKLTRLLQPCLSGKGKTTIVLTLNPTPTQAAETAMSLKFGVRAMKDQEHLTLEDYKARVQDLQVHLVQLRSENAARVSEFRWYEKKVNDLHEKCTAAQRENVEKDTKLLEREQAIRDKVTAEHRSLLMSYEQQLGAQQDNIEDELAALTERNKARLEEGEAQRRAREDEISAETERFKQEQDERLAALQARNDELKSAEDVQLPDEEALKAQLAAAREEVEELRYKVRDCTPSPYAGLTLLKLKEKLAKLSSQRQSLIAKKKDLKYIQEDQERTRAFQLAKDGEVDSDHSEVASSGSIGEARSMASSEDLFDNKRPGEPSAMDVRDRLQDERERKEREAAAARDEEQSPVIDPELEAQIFEKIETGHLRKALTREASLRELVEYILQYLEHGCPVWVVGLQTHSEEPGIEKKFMYLDQSREVVYLCGVTKNGTPDRQVTQVIRKDMIRDIMLGQYSPAFLHHNGQLADDYVPPPRHYAVDPVEELSHHNLFSYFYRSFSVRYCPDRLNDEEEAEDSDISEEDRDKYLDVVACIDSDFEAWAVTLHRIMQDILPEFLYELPGIDGMEGEAELDNEEYRYCAMSHITPKQYREAKAVLFTEDRLYLTLYEVRILTNFDLLTSQKLYDLFGRLGLIERRTIWIIASAKYAMVGPGRLPLVKNLKNKKTKDVRGLRARNSVAAL